MMVMVKVTPKSRRPGLQGRSADGIRLRIGVSDAPEDGRATRAACEMLAEALDLPWSAVQLVQGASRREKTLAVAGDPLVLAERLACL